MFSDVLFGNNGTSQAADDKASDSGDSKTGDTTKSGTGEQSTSSSTDGSSDTASNTSTDSAQSDTTSSSSDGSADATDTNGQGTDSTASSDAQSTPPATAEANKATSVRVINGTKISGHAASRAYTLKQADTRTSSPPTPPVRCPRAPWSGTRTRPMRDREGHRRDLGHLRRAADVGHLRTRRRRADAVTVHRRESASP